MIHYAYVDMDGFVMRSGSALTVPPGAILLPEGGPIGIAALDLRIISGQFKRRPELPGPEVTAFQVNGLAIRFAGLPAGTTAEITDTLIGQQMAVLPEVQGIIQIELIDPGLYRIEVNPPRPWLQMIMTLEVAP